MSGRGDTKGLNKFLTQLGLEQEEIQRFLKANEEIMKDVCEFYGISPEQYLKKVSGIGSVEDLKGLRKEGN